MGVIAGALAVLGTAATIKSLDEQREAQKEQEKAAEIEEAKADIQNARQRRRAVAQARVQQAQAANAAAVSGRAGSSAEAGAIAGIGSQTASNIGLQRTVTGANTAIRARQRSANRSLGRANTFGALANLSFQGANVAAGAAGDTPQQNNTPTVANNPFAFDQSTQASFNRRL